MLDTPVPSRLAVSQYSREALSRSDRLHLERLHIQRRFGRSEMERPTDPSVPDSRNQLPLLAPYRLVDTGALSGASMVRPSGVVWSWVETDKTGHSI